MVEKSILKSCPFCGGEAKTDSRYIGYGSVGLGSHDEHYIKCVECRAVSDEFRDKKQAIAAWNRRFVPEARVLTIVELRKMNGLPVWVDPIPHGIGRQREVEPFYGIIGKTYGVIRPSRIIVTKTCSPRHETYYEDDYGKTWLAYDRKPAEGVRG